MFSLSKFSGHSPRCLTSYINQEIKSCIRLQIIITQPNTFARTLCIRMQLKVILKKYMQRLCFLMITFIDYSRSKYI